jgi:hypothetical protein
MPSEGLIEPVRIMGKNSSCFKGELGCFEVRNYLGGVWNFGACATGREGTV